MKSQLNTQRVARSVAATLAIATLAAPAALARPIDTIERSDVVRAPTAAPHATVESTDQGFDWGSAGIGASVAAGIVALTAGGVLVRSRARVGSLG